MTKYINITLLGLIVLLVALGSMLYSSAQTQAPTTAVSGPTSLTVTPLLTGYRTYQGIELQPAASITTIQPAADSKVPVIEIIKKVTIQ